MIIDPEDTIIALSSAIGPGMRAIVRCTGPLALLLTQQLANITLSPRCLTSTSFRFATIYAPLPVEVIYYPGPRSYTGQDIIELHFISSPPLIDAMMSEYLSRGTRMAEPGEFTLRAFLAGKCDLPRAEAILSLIDAKSTAEMRQSLQQLAGGMTAPIDELRNDLLNLLADVEAGLDFVDEDIEFVEQPVILLRLAKGMAQLTLLQKQLVERTVEDRPYRVVLVGPPNAGKSSLFNALVGDAISMISPISGTTRDYISHRYDVEGGTIELIDTAGWEAGITTIQEQAQRLGQTQAEQADALLCCIPAWVSLPLDHMSLPRLILATQADLARPDDDRLPVSIVSGEGLAEVQAWFNEQFHHRRPTELSLSGTRCRQHIDSALDHLRKSHAIVLFGDPQELLALELHGALNEIGELVGAVYTEDLLGRIFSRFCIGK